MSTLTASPTVDSLIHELRQTGQRLFGMADLRDLGLAKDPRTIRAKMRHMGAVRTGHRYQVTLQNLERYLKEHYQPNPAEQVVQMLDRKHVHNGGSHAIPGGQK